MMRYIVGFAISIVVTLAAYFAVVNRILVGWNLVFFIVGLALFQLLIQLVFFLHVNLSDNQRWNLAAVVSTAGVILILVVGSLLIMNNLDYRHTAPTNAEIMEREAIFK